ncbi:MAG: transporter related [Rhodocyclales bacterium]|nr:transporter related [Rhodocyclales bacterium]
MDRAPIERTPLVVIKDVSMRYRLNSLDVLALSGINVSVDSGEFLAFVGPSGSGKTSLLNLIGALDRPSSGKVVVGDTEVSSAPASRLAEFRLRKIGFVFQDYNLLPVLTALENVEYVLMLQGVAPDVRRRRANEALVEIGLDGCQNRRPSQLSGGQQQRVAIARALAARPLLILADEPTANLDSATGEALIQSMLTLNRNHGTTFVFSTHDDMVMSHASRIVRLKDGHIVESTAHAIS